jgi:SAM-dependent methyltransferase
MEIVNVDQASAWDGDDGDYWTKHEEPHDAAVRAHHARLFDVARILADDYVLDIGCGCGETTRQAARAAVSGRALGVDLSARMLERARERARAEGFTNVSFEQADAQVYPFESEAFDLAISRFGGMFFADPVAAFTNIGRALRRGGRLVLLAWQELPKNEWLSAFCEAVALGRTLPVAPVGTPGPFGLADPAGVRRILSEAGFEGVVLEEVQAPFYLGANSDDAFGFASGLGFTRGMLRGLNDTDRARALEQLRATMVAHDTGDGVVFGSSAWIITAHRT